MRNRSRTSDEILEERDALHARALELEATLVTARDEVEHALRYPEMSFLAICRLRAIVRRAVPEAAQPDDEIPGPPISNVRPTSEKTRASRRSA